MEVDAIGSKNWAFTWEENGGGGFQKEEGLFGALVVEFCDVVGVVAAYADDLLYSGQNSVIRASDVRVWTYLAAVLLDGVHGDFADAICESSALYECC